MTTKRNTTRRGMWAKTLTPEQREAVQRIRRGCNGGIKDTQKGEGWSVYMMPTTMTPTYLELRHYMTEGGVARWVIEQDGSVSADNANGQLSALRTVA